MGHLREAFRDLRGGGFHILLYHSISQERRYPFAVSPQEFAWQMDWLHRQGVCVQSLEEALRAEGQGGKPRVVISFDDGYEDNFTNALPILNQYGYKATFFIVTAFVGRSNGWSSSSPEFKLMNWEQLKTLAGQGHIIGGHTQRHVNLETADDTQARQELVESQRLLAEKLPQGFVPFAYPYGKYTQTTIELVTETGYSCALAAGGFWGNSMHTSRWELKREDIRQAISRRDFMARVRVAADPHYFKLGISYLKGK